MQYLSYIIVAILVSVVLKSLGKSKTSAINNEGFKVMKLSKGYASLGKVTLFVWSLVYVVFLFDTIHNSSSVKNSGDLADYLIPNFIFLGFMGISVVLVAYDKYTVLYNDTKIIFHGLLGKIIEVNWKDIVRVSFSKVGLQFYISDKNNRIYVHKHLSGFNSFVEQLKSTVGTALIQKALIDLEDTGRR